VTILPENPARSRRPPERGRHLSQDVERSKAQLERLVGPGMRDVEGKRHRLMEIFEVSSQYEWLFWEMCWKGESWPIPVEPRA